MWMFANNLELYTLRNDQAIDNLSSEKKWAPLKLCKLTLQHLCIIGRSEVVKQVWVKLTTPLT